MQYDVWITYKATKHTTIEAESREAAERLANQDYEYDDIEIDDVTIYEDEE